MKRSSKFISIFTLISLATPLVAHALTPEEEAKLKTIREKVTARKIQNIYRTHKQAEGQLKTRSVNVDEEIASDVQNIIQIQSALPGLGTFGESTCQASTDQSRSMYSYSINTMWINKRLIADQKYIFPDSVIAKGLLDNFKKWREGNQKYPIYFWFDSTMTTPEQVANTHQLLGPNIELKDIRSIKAVEENSDVFGENVNVWSRVDLLKHIIGEHLLLSQKEPSIFVFADLDIIPESIEDEMNKKLTDLYTQKIYTKLDILRTVGLLDNVKENNFMMFSNIFLHEQRENIIKPGIAGIREELATNDGTIKPNPNGGDFIIFAKLFDNGPIRHKMHLNVARQTGAKVEQTQNGGYFVNGVWYGSEIRGFFPVKATQPVKQTTYSQHEVPYYYGK